MSVPLDKPDYKYQYLPTRKFLPRNEDFDCDTTGFLSPDNNVLGISELLAMTPVVIILAPPWLGKSHVARQLRQSLSIERPGDTERRTFGTYFQYTSFEDAGGHGRPLWWDRWKALDGQRACWVVDALDEDPNGIGTDHIFGVIDSLDGAQRSRLTALFFVRENEVPPRVTNWVAEFNRRPAGPEHDPVKTVHLAPVDAEDAVSIAGSAEIFGKVCRLINENGLQSLAGYPSALETLSRYPAGARVSAVQVWRDVLRDLLHERRVEKLVSPPIPPVDLRFKAAAWLAAALTFGTQEEISDGRSLAGGASIDRLMPRDHEGAEKLAIAGRHAIRSAVFTRTIDGYRFRQRHVREWLAAFGVANFTLSRLKPLVTAADGNLDKRYQGVMCLLMNTSQSTEVSDWIRKQFGGVVPRSDAAPWGLSESVAALDQLQKLAKESPTGLVFWDDRGFHLLRVQGLGAVLSERMADKSLTLFERELMINVARATGSGEVTKAANEIVLDSAEPECLRISAALVVFKFGDIAEQMKLGEFATTFLERDPADCALRATIAFQLYSKKLWSYQVAVDSAPALEDCGEDPSPSTLLFRLERDMTAADARKLLRSADLELALKELDAESSQRGRHPRFGKSKLFLRAIELLSEETVLADGDLHLLLPVALNWHRREWQGFRPKIALIDKFAATPGSKRQLLEAALGLSVSSDRDVTLRLSMRVLRADDFDWLRDLARQHGDTPILWEWILQAVNDLPGWSDRRDEVRTEISRSDPGMLERFDLNAAELQKQLADIERDEEDARRSYPQPEIFEVQSITEVILEGSLPLFDKMIRLTQICLARDQFRPSNVRGQWGDLPEQTKQRVFAVCRSALEKCPPTPIPVGNSYPEHAVYEAQCFAALVVGPGSPFTADGLQIERWLPGALIFSGEHFEAVLTVCWKNEPAATETVLMNEVRRRLQSGGLVSYSSADMFTVCWSDSIAENALALCESREFPAAGRIVLLREVAAHDAPRATAVLRRWLVPLGEQGSESVLERLAALDLLLAIDPQAAWPEFVREFGQNGRNAFLACHSIAGGHHGVRFDLASWPRQLLGELAGLLHQAFPPESDPVRVPGEAYAVGIEDDFRRLRWAVLEMLVKADEGDAGGYLRELIAKHELVRTWHDMLVAGRSATEIFRHISAPSDGEPRGTVPLDEVVRVLSDDRFRLLRTAGDLQTVVCEELQLIGQNMREHLSLLYSSNVIRQKSKSPSRTRLGEDALQAYFFCRLKDRLAVHVLSGETTVKIINREPLSTKNQRLDIKIEAPCVGGLIATVIIELKWSDNPDLSVSLVEQLGKEYLVGAHLTHGIYLVGWVGKGSWSKKSDMPKPARPATPQAWLAALERQAENFAKAHSEISIRPILVDLEWPMPK